MKTVRRTEPLALKHHKQVDKKAVDADKQALKGQAQNGGPIEQGRQLGFGPQMGFYCVVGTQRSMGLQIS